MDEAARTVAEAVVYAEGRCRQCGMRVTVERLRNGHMRDGRWCGPVETEHPFSVRDELPIGSWIERPH